MLGSYRYDEQQPLLQSEQTQYNANDERIQENESVIFW